MDQDTIVIGSGAGGLAAAVALARAGQRVLVLEQHYLPGGWCHSFALEGHRFSPGVHYLGELGPGGGLRRVYEGLGVGADLEFVELEPDGYDHFLIAGERFDVPAGRDRLVARLAARFPAEREGIARYFATLGAVRDELARCDPAMGAGAVLALPWRAPTLARWGLRTLGALLDATVRDPRLRAVLAANTGNHGLPPDRVSLPVHAAMVGHYMDGAYYPRGGAKRLPQALLRELRRRGGAVRTSARVASILVERGRAAGVVLESGERITARNVVSNADPALTYGRLLPEHHRGWRARRAASMEYSVASVSLFCAVDMDLRAAGLDGGNWWWFRTGDVEGTYARMARALPGDELEGLFLAVPTLKDPSPRTRHHTVEMFTFVPWAPFARWAGSPLEARGGEYEALKASLARRMLAAADRVVPGFSRRVVFAATGTPLTNDFYCASVRGAVYGTAKTRGQVGPFGTSVRSHVPGLWCCGASTLGHGVAGATASGLLAAQQVLGARSVEELLGPADGSLRVVAGGAHEVDTPREERVSARAV